MLSTRRGAAIGVALAAILLLSGGCGSNAGAPRQKEVLTPGNPMTALTSAARGFARAYATGDANQAWDLLSRGCQAKVSRRKFMSRVFGHRGRRKPGRIRNYVVHRSGPAHAVVRYDDTVKVLDMHHQNWSYSDLQWHLDSC